MCTYEPSAPLGNQPQITDPTETALFRAKCFLLQTVRSFQDGFLSPVSTLQKNEVRRDDPVIAESKSLLWAGNEAKEKFLVAGKIHNLRLALSKIDGIEVPGGETFSFWKQIGRVSRHRGYVSGREIREGCVIPNIGGGLCQLSNALYDAALTANFEIVERHRHTQIIPGSLAEQGRDATVFWNYVDLRFRSRSPFTIDAKMNGEALTVRFRGTNLETKRLYSIHRNLSNGHANDCITCGMDDCFRAVKPDINKDFGRSAFLVDEFTPEFGDYVQQCRNIKDVLCIPLDGRRFRKSNYAWATDGFGKVDQSLFVTAVRSYKSRSLAAQGAARQRNLLSMYERLAESYAKKLNFDVLHVVVQQNLLPFLWQAGHLGGRTFDVLMTAMPMAELQKQLDIAFSLHPESKTLADFRVDNSLIEAEAEALRNARRIITPHSGIASLFDDRAELLTWKRSEQSRIPSSPNGKPCIVFPASTVGRKGGYELRAALHGMPVRLVTLGPYIEDSDFWHGFDVVKGDANWLQHADLVVLPAFVEHRPRRLLNAASFGHSRYCVRSLRRCPRPGRHFGRTRQCGNARMVDQDRTLSIILILSSI